MEMAGFQWYSRALGQRIGESSYTYPISLPDGPVAIEGLCSQLTAGYIEGGHTAIDQGRTLVQFTQHNSLTSS